MEELTAVEAKVRFGALLDAVERGEEIVITRNGKAVARIIPAQAGRLTADDALRRMATFAQRHALRLDGVDWRDLRDEGRK
ncbi:type II toxin-antitoxin system prevent-host-death family antitoxin [bacterium]|nr:type II toxin-antitoxin system prevent-host-death family antitoxin [bacterium]